MDYLPRIVFPFLLAYGNDEIAALETVMTLFLWWGHSWFATFPFPPLHVADAITDLLTLYDKPVHSHITNVLGHDPGLIGWGMISSLFTEIFDKSDWFKVLVSYQFSFFKLIPHILLRTGFHLCPSR